MIALHWFLFVRVGINFILYATYSFVKIALLIQLLLLQKCYGDGIPPCCFKPFSVMRSLVSLVFGAPLGVVQRNENEYKPDGVDTRNNVPIATLYIRQTQLSYRDIELLTVVIVTFVIIALSSSLNASLVKVTRICSEDPNIFCYPEAIDPNDDIRNNITHGEVITDCAFWNSEGVSSRVTFICFRYMLSFGIFFAVFGGLLAVFTFTMKFAAGALLFLAEKCKCCDKRAKCARQSVAIIALVVEYVPLSISLGFAIQAFEDDTVLEALQRLFPKVALAAGIISSTLWLPWEDYVKKKNAATSDEYYAVAHLVSV